MTLQVGQSRRSTNVHSCAGVISVDTTKGEGTMSTYNIQDGLSTIGNSLDQLVNCFHVGLIQAAPKRGLDMLPSHSNSKEIEAFVVP